jgi:hypothetical protein
MLTTPLASDIQIVLHHKARPSAYLAFLLLNLNREKHPIVRQRITMHHEYDDRISTSDVVDAVA